MVGIILGFSLALNILFIGIIYAAWKFQAGAIKGQERIVRKTMEFYKNTHQGQA